MIGIGTAIGGGLKFAAELAEKSKNGDLIEAGEAQANADNWKAVNEKFMEFQRAAESINDPAVRELLRGAYTTD